MSPQREKCWCLPSQKLERNTVNLCSANWARCLATAVTSKPQRNDFFKNLTAKYAESEGKKGEGGKGTKHGIEKVLEEHETSALFEYFFYYALSIIA